MLEVHQEKILSQLIKEKIKLGRKKNINGTDHLTIGKQTILHGKKYARN